MSSSPGSGGDGGPAPPSDRPIRITYQSINKLGGDKCEGTRAATKAGRTAPSRRKHNHGAPSQESEGQSLASPTLQGQGTKDRLKGAPVNPSLGSPSPQGSSSSRLSPEAVPFTPLSVSAAIAASASDPGQRRNNARMPVPKPSTDKDQEIKQLSRRYAPAHGFRQAKTKDGSIMVTFDKPIEDPDFPFDLTSLKLRITLPPGYPQREPPKVEVLNEEIPVSVKERIQNRLADQARLLVGEEPFIRALLRVLDQHLERWMVALPTLDTRSSTIKVVPLGELSNSHSSYRGSSSSRTGEDQGDHRTHQLRDRPSNNNHQDVGSRESEQMDMSEGTATLIPSHLSPEDCVAHSLEMLKVGVPVKRELAGTVGRFHPPSHIRLDQPTPGVAARAGAIQIDLLRVSINGVSLAIPILLGLALTCGRCRARTNLLDLLPDRDRIIPCSGCKQHMEVAWTRELVHEHCHRFGFIRCKRCSPADLLPCVIQIVCGQCDPPGIGEGDSLANAVRVEGVQVGERLAFACRQCHRSLALSYEAVQWTVIPALAAARGGTTAAATAKSQPLPTRIGEPLPGLGTCAHYRKSHRWFRFPCCGQAYPCDECHREANPGHPGEWATRQICGYCSREFSTSQKHCDCGETPGEAARRTAHWEGGKGTRDQLTMSRKDKKKYRNLTKK